MEISKRNKKFLKNLEKEDIIGYKIHNVFDLAEIYTKENKTYVMNLETFDLYLDRLIEIINKEK